MLKRNDTRVNTRLFEIHSGRSRRQFHYDHESNYGIVNLHFLNLGLSSLAPTYEDNYYEKQ